MAGGSEHIPWRARLVSTVARPLSRAPRTSGVPTGYTLANIHEAEVGKANFADLWNENGTELEETAAQASLQDRFGQFNWEVCACVARVNMQCNSVVLQCGSQDLDL